MKKEREPIEAVLIKKEKHGGVTGTFYGQPGHADYYKAQYMYCDGNRDRKYVCYCLGNPPQSIYLVGGIHKRPIGEFAGRSTTKSKGFVAYRASASISGRVVGFLLAPAVIPAAFMLVLFVLKSFGL